MSKIKNGRLDQYGAEAFEQQQFGTAGVEGVKCRIPLKDVGLKSERNTRHLRNRLVTPTPANTELVITGTVQNAVPTALDFHHMSSLLASTKILPECSKYRPTSATCFIKLGLFVKDTEGCEKREMRCEWRQSRKENGVPLLISLQSATIG